ncbi:2-aminoethylphosphonate ABC transporter, 2-aminoethylphosphonate binding protein [compost metagenome]
MSKPSHRRSLSLISAGTLAILALSGCAGGQSSPAASAGTETNFAGQQLTVTAYAGAWGDKFKKAFIAPFEKATGATVNVVSGADAEWFTKLRAANGQNPPFDLTVFTPEMVPQAVRARVIEPLDESRVPGFGDLNKYLLEESTAGDAQYGVPLTNGVLGLAYRTDKVAKAPTDWSDLFNEQNCGHIGMSPLSYSAGLQFLAAIIHDDGGKMSNPADVEKAFTKLEAIKKCVSTFPADAAGVTTALQNGDAWIVPFWDGRAFAMGAQGDPIGFTYPESGAVGAPTSYYLAKGTKKSDLAYKFLEQLANPANQKEFAEATGYAAGSDAVQYSEEMGKKIQHGDEAYKSFTWVDYDAAVPNLTAWQSRWNEVFAK